MPLIAQKPTLLICCIFFTFLLYFILMSALTFLRSVLLSLHSVIWTAPEVVLCLWEANLTKCLLFL